MNFLLVGKPGCGKTTAACTGQHPTLLVDIDGKAAEMKNIQPLVEKGDVVIKTFRQKLVEDRLSYRALNPDKPPKKQPEGYVTIVDYLNDIVDEAPEFDQFNTIVLDSLTRLTEHLKRLLLYHRGKGKFGKKVEGDMNWPSWGSYLANLEEVFYALQNYMVKHHFICTAHLTDEVEIDPFTDVRILKGHWPMVDGQMKQKLAGYFNECYFLEAKFVKAKEPVYSFRTYGDKTCARTSLALDELEPANIMNVLKKGGIL